MWLTIDQKYDDNFACNFCFKLNLLDQLILRIDEFKFDYTLPKT